MKHARSVATRLIALMLTVAVAAVLPNPSAGAITDGYPDSDNEYPHVVLVVADAPTNEDENAGWRCSGTLLSSTIVLTAGHCVSAFPAVDPVTGDPVEITGMRVFPAQDVQAWIDDNPDTHHYPGPGEEAIEAVEWAAHPDYENAPFFFNDVGVIRLDEAIVLDTYGVLPEVDSLDDLKRGRKTMFTAVGYGLQEINPVHVTAERTRMVSHPHLIMIDVPGFTGGFSMMLSNNHSTGGTCFGDSGGPNFLGDSNIVAGVTSFGINGNCAGTGGVYRMDQASALAFVQAWLDYEGVCQAANHQEVAC